MTDKFKKPEIPHTADAEDALDIFADDIDNHELEKSAINKPGQEQTSTGIGEKMFMFKQ